MRDTSRTRTWTRFARGRALTTVAAAAMMAFAPAHAVTFTYTLDATVTADVPGRVPGSLYVMSWVFSGTPLATGGQPGNQSVVGLPSTLNMLSSGTSTSFDVVGLSSIRTSLQNNTLQIDYDIAGSNRSLFFSPTVGDLFSDFSINVEPFQFFNVFSVDTNRGTVFLRSFTPTRTTFSLRVEQAPAVPEPATWAMMIGGFGMIGAAMRYRRRRVTVRYA